MELADIQAIYAQYPIKANYLKHPSRRQDLLPQIANVNRLLTAISPEELRTFLENVNRNPQNVAFITDQFRQIREVVAREQTYLDGANHTELEQLLSEDVAIFRSICREIRHHYTRDVQVKVIGYGEITTSLVLSDGVKLDSHLRPEFFPSHWVYKSLPKFPSMEEVRNYERAFYQYVDLLDQAGLDLPEQKLAIAERDAEGIRIYVVQRRLSSDLIGNVLIRSLSQPQALALLKKIILKISDVFASNLGNKKIRLALDGQISNWHSQDSEPATPILYIDTSTPLFRVDDQEQLNPELFLKNTPSFLRAIIRAFFLQDVLDRYYDFRSVLVDLIANLYKEGREDLVYPAVEMVNEMLGRELQALDVEPLTEKEIDAYYREDAFIWRLFQTARRIDKFITEKILRKRYALRLPEKIDR